MRLREEIGLSGPPAGFFLGNMGDIVRRAKKLGYGDGVQRVAEWVELYGKSYGLVSMIVFKDNTLKVYGSMRSAIGQCTVMTHRSTRIKVWPFKRNCSRQFLMQSQGLRTFFSLIGNNVRSLCVWYVT